MGITVIVFKLEIVIILLFLLYCIIDSDIEKRRNKKFDESFGSDLYERQKARILKSVNKRMSKLYFLVLLLLFFTMLLCIMYFSDDFGSNIFSGIFVLLSIVAIFVFSFMLKIKQTTIKDNIRKNIINDLEKKYGRVIILPTPKIKIVEGDKTREGNVRNVYLLSVVIEKYNCNLVCYYKEKLMGRSDSDTLLRYYKYGKTDFLIDYIYNFNNDNSNKQRTIDLEFSKLAEKRFINMKFENNCLRIKKKTVLYGYNESDSNIDTDDVKEFYDKLIKE